MKKIIKNCPISRLSLAKAWQEIMLKSEWGTEKSPDFGVTRTTVTNGTTRWVNPFMPEGMPTIPKKMTYVNLFKMSDAIIACGCDVVFKQRAVGYAYDTHTFEGVVDGVVVKWVFIWQSPDNY